MIIVYVGLDDMKTRYKKQKKKMRTVGKEARGLLCSFDYDKDLRLNLYCNGEIKSE